MEISDRLDLIGKARQRAGGDDPLVLLDAATAVAAEAGASADAVVDHFVQAARRAGLSWTTIGDRLGVSKQAARQRFADSPPTAASIGVAVAPRLQACLDAGRAAARDGGSAVLGTQHLLVGLMTVGVAANALDRLGVTRQRVQDINRDLFTPVTAGDAAASVEDPDEDPDVRAALAGARRLAGERGCGWVATEHLLFVLATDPGSAARRVLNALDVSVSDIKRELECFLQPVRQSRRGRRHRPGRAPACSFCGKSADGLGLRLVAGPGVWICAECVQLCTEIIEEERADAAQRR